MSKDLSGHYMCRTENPMGSNSFTFILNVKEEEILSAGAIAGIVIGSVGAVALIALVLFLIFRDRKKSTTKHEDDQSHTLQLGGNQYQPPPRSVSYENAIPRQFQNTLADLGENGKDLNVWTIPTTMLERSKESEPYLQSNPSETEDYDL
ncbi:coxsackievirus and adenovirus receptor homolog [Bufo bufo]|uniref:coxsackievirus and adenovirus receptor homolog n=1 Tax=Bufo bufo TaxID=8384 RepID=UPI001ABDED1A|nr:coxsackievirus and adenovirus receptor homolog [Bufo bufo]